MTRPFDALADLNAFAARRNKFGNIPTEVDGLKFSSRKEARRYGELKLLVKAGQINDLRLQPRYPLVVNGKKVCAYVADFAYRTRLGVEIVEDVKSEITRKNPLYRVKAKLFDALMGFPVTEV